MADQKTKGLWTKHRHPSFPHSVRQRMVRYIVPKHSETTLYVLAIAFFGTLWLNAAFREMLIEMSEPNADGESGIIIIVLFLLGAVSALVAAFVPKHIPGFRTFLAPAFIVFGSLLLTLEYIGIQLESGGFIGMLFAMYHGVVILALLSIYKHGRNKISQNISKDHANFPEIVAATAVTALVFIYAYYATSLNEISWAIPVTISLLAWQLLESAYQKIST